MPDIVLPAPAEYLCDLSRKLGAVRLNRAFHYSDPLLLCQRRCRRCHNILCHFVECLLVQALRLKRKADNVSPASNHAVDS